MDSVDVHPSALLIGDVVFGGPARVGPFAVIGGETYQVADVPLDTDRSCTRLGAHFSLQAFSYVGGGTVIGAHFRGDAHAYVGTGCTFGEYVVVEYGARVYNRVIIGDGSWIGGFVCNEARIGSRCVIQGSLVHRRTAPHPEPAPIVQDDVLIGANAVVVGGIVIAEGCVVAAGAVIVEDTDPGFMYAGVPARKRGPAHWM
jgi:carbonic anhydrase/acetyltransferase-like protein (isoleucine patch superfamily)